MLTVSIKNYVITLEGAGITMTLSYPFRPITVYEFVWECCNRFNKEADLDPDSPPTIYVYGEMYKPSQFMNKLASIAEKAGATVEITN